jgi:hypothetical protein
MMGICQLLLIALSDSAEALKKLATSTYPHFNRQASLFRSLTEELRWCHENPEEAEIKMRQEEAIERRNEFKAV